MPNGRLLSGNTRTAVGVLAVSMIAALYLASISTSNPPGFYRDESNIAFTAASVAATGRDQHGALFPLYFSALGDWKSAPYIYLLAGVYAVTGPSELVARALSATLGLGAVALLGLLGFQLTGRRSVGIGTAALAAMTPWLFEVTRLVFEVSLEPLLIAGFLVVLASVRNRLHWPLLPCLALGLLLALINYAYAAGRGLAPVLAFLLVVFARRGRVLSIVVTWIVFAVALVPMAIFERHHSGALFVRYHSTSAIGGRGIFVGARTLLSNIFHDSNLWRWATSGDGNPRHHVQGTGSLLLAGVLLAVAGLGIVISRKHWDAFWAYVVLGAGASVVPDAVTVERIHSLRAIGLPVFLVALAVPAVALIVERAAAFRWRILGTAVLVAAIAQFALFEVEYWRDGPRRVDAFQATFPAVFRRAASTKRPIVVYENDYEAFGNAQWFGRLWNITVHYLPSGRPIPSGSVVVANVVRCRTCAVIMRAGGFTAYVRNLS